MRKPLVNIVIVTANQLNFVDKCIESLFAARYKNIKIFAVDNNSDKEAYEKFYNKHKKFKNIVFLRLKKNTGFAGGCNFALKHIKEGYVVFLNDDTIVSRDWLDPMISYMEKYPEVGACQPKIKSMRKKDYFEHAGAAGGFMDVYGYPFCRGRIFFSVEKDKGQYDDIIDVTWVSGTCMMTRMDIIKKVGVMDEIFFFYGEEVDLCWRMNYHGYRLVYIPSSTIYHYGSGTMRSSSSIKAFLHHRNHIILLLKNYTIIQIIKHLPFKLLLDFIAFWYYLLDNKLPQNSLAIIRAYISILLLLPKIIKSRKNAAFKTKKIGIPPYPLYDKSVIIDYFIRGKKKYSQL